jgi:glycosyltransferase involved in cell wall biosynthesis
MWRVKTILSLLKRGQFGIALSMIYRYLTRRTPLLHLTQSMVYEEKFLNEIPVIISRPLVSILIPNHNLSDYLEKCLSHILNQTYTNFEILISNTGCNPENLESARRLQEKFKHQKIKWFQQPLAGPGANRNFLAANAIGEYLFIIDPDDFMTPRTLEFSVVTALWKQADVVAPSCYINGVISKPWILWKEINLDLVIERNQIPSCCLISRECFEVVGGYKDFDKNGNRIHEDWNFNIRLLAMGFSIRTISVPLVDISVRSGSYSSRAELQDIKRQSMLMKELNADVLNKNFKLSHNKVKNNCLPAHANKRNIGIVLHSARSSGTTRKASIAIEIARSLGYNPIVFICSPTIEGADEVLDAESVELHKLSEVRDYMVWISQILGTESKVWNIDSEWIYDGFDDLLKLSPDIKIWDTVYLERHSRTRKALRNRETQIVFAETMELFTATKVLGNGIYMPNHPESDPVSIKSKNSTVKSIGILSRLSPEKNVSLAIEIGVACQKLFNKDLIVFVAGTGNLESYLRDRYKDNSQIVFMGQIEGQAKNEFFDSLDFLIVTSFIDGISSSIIESIGKGVPVAITPGTPSAEFVVSIKGGVVISSVPSKAAEAIFAFHSDLVEGRNLIEVDNLLQSRSEFMSEILERIIKFT